MRRTLIYAAIAFSIPILFFFIFIRGGKPSAQSTDPAENQVLQNLSGNFDATANINYKGISATATITQDSPLSCLVAFTAPDTLKDMRFEFSRDSVEVSYKGLSFDFDPSSVPGGSVANLAVSAINKVLLKEGLALSYEDGALAVGGSNENGAFTLVLDEETGNFLKLSVPDHQLEIDFSNFAFLE